MRIVLFERIPPSWGMTFGLAIAGLEIFQGTHLFFSVCFFMLIQIWVLAVNTAGGFRRAMGAYVFWFGLFTIIFGVSLKSFIGEAADTLCVAPLLTMEIFTISMFMLLVSVLLTQRILGTTKSLAERLMANNPLPYREAAIGSTILGILAMFSSEVLGGGSGSIGNLLSRMNLFLYLASILGTVACIKESNGKRSVGFYNLLPGVTQFLWGFAGFSKEGMFTPVACWLIGVAFTRFSFRKIHFAVLAVILVTANYVLFPLAQIGRNLPSPPGVVGHIGVGLTVLENFSYWKKQSDIAEQQSLAAGGHYYAKDVGLAERFSTWPGDSALIAYTEKGHVFGFAYLNVIFLNWFPHFIFPDKDKYMTIEGGGNYYGRELGIIPFSDTTTGISFSTIAEAFHMGRWLGIFLLLPASWVLFFLSVEVLCGDLRIAPWGLFYAMFFIHMAPESGISGLLGSVWFTNIGLVFCMLFATYVAPLLGKLFFREKLRAGGSGSRIRSFAPSIEHANRYTGCWPRARSPHE